MVWLASQISSDVDEFCKRQYEDGHRSHLGASLIGHECSRYLWYIFRWIREEEFEGRMLRLFNRGHNTEPRFIEWLRGIGFEVLEFNPEEPDKQFRIAGVGGHFGGSLDTIGGVPERYKLILEKLRALGRILVEYKTHSVKSFTKLKKEGVALSKPQHKTQMDSYGNAYGLEYSLYCGICKDTDEIHFEIVKNDFREGELAEQKASYVIGQQSPPPRMSENPTFYKCKFCHLSDLCHYNEGKVEVNCRSCTNAQPANNGEWYCHLYKDNIPKNFIPQGCQYWKSIA